MNAGKKKGIVCFDLDGTLLDNATDVIPESALHTIALLRKAYYIVISTGRDMDGHYSVRYRDMIRPDAIIHLNGSRVTLASGETLLEHFMDPALLRRLLHYAEAHGYCFGTTIGDEDFYTAREKKEEADLAYNRFIRRNFHPAEELLSRGLSVRALSYAGDLKQEQAAIETAFPQLRLIPFSSGRGADVVERGFSKAEGLKLLCTHYGIDRKNTIAFGDSLNDMEIIRYAGTGIAMGNAVEELKQAADYVTDTHRNDGIKKACEHLHLIDAI